MTFAKQSRIVAFMGHPNSSNFLWTPQEANELANRCLPMDTRCFYEGVVERVPLPRFRTTVDFLIRAGRVAVTELSPLWILDALPNQGQLQATPGFGEFGADSYSDVSDSGIEALRHGVIVPGEGGAGMWVKPTNHRLLDVPFNRFVGTAKNLSELPEGAQPVRLQLATSPTTSA